MSVSVFSTSLCLVCESSGPVQSSVVDDGFGELFGRGEDERYFDKTKWMRL